MLYIASLRYILERITYFTIHALKLKFMFLSPVIGFLFLHYQIFYVLCQIYLQYGIVNQSHQKLSWKEGIMLSLIVVPINNKQNIHADPEKFCQGSPGNICFSYQRISQRAVWTSPEGFNCFSKGVRTSISKKTYRNSFLPVMFQGGGVRTPCPSLDPSMTYLYLVHRLQSS